MRRSHLCACIACALGLAVAYALFFGLPRTASAQEAKPVSFINDVAPILKESCFGCHGAKNPKGKLDMTTVEKLRKGGTKDDPIVPGKPGDSYLLDVLKATDNTRMPPKENGGEALSPQKIAVLERWIKEGAKIDAGLTDKSDLPRELRLRWTPPPPKDVYAYPVAVTALAFTPDGKKVVAGGHHELTVWDAATGKLEKRVHTRARRTMALLFLADGKLVAAGGRPGEEGDVRVYDLNAAPKKTADGVAYLDGVGDTKVLLKQLVESDDEVLCLALSADGKKLAAGGCDRIVRVWDIAEGVEKAKEEQAIENHADWVFGVAFAADGKHLMTAGRDKTAKMWDLAAKESVLTFPDHQNTVYGVGIKADGKTAFSAGEDNNVRTWNTQGANAGKQIKVLGGHGKPVLKMAIHPSQPLIATAGADKTVRTWNTDAGTAAKTMAGHNDFVYSVAFSPDGALLASGAWDGEVRVWKVDDAALVKNFNASPGK